MAGTIESGATVALTKDHSNYFLTEICLKKYAGSGKDYGRDILTVSSSVEYHQEGIYVEVLDCASFACTDFMTSRKLTQAKALSGLKTENVQIFPFAGFIFQFIQNTSAFCNAYVSMSCWNLN